MAALVGKWQLYSSENFDNYMKAIGVSPEMIEKAKAALGESSKLTIEFTQTGDDWTITTTTSLGVKKITFKLGQEFETTTLDGRPVKVVMQEEGGDLVEVQTGDGFQSRNTRVGRGDEMVATMCGGGVTATRKYKRV